MKNFPGGFFYGILRGRGVNQEGRKNVYKIKINL